MTDIIIGHNFLMLLLYKNIHHQNTFIFIVLTQSRSSNNCKLPLNRYSHIILFSLILFLRLQFKIFSFNVTVTLFSTPVEYYETLTHRSLT